MIAISAKTSFAWGQFGHLTVCDLAYRNLTDTSKDKLKQLFNVKAGGITVLAKNGVSKRHYTSFNLGCLEEDEIPRKHPKDHFLNVSRQTTSITRETLCPAGSDCIFSGIERDIKALKDQNLSNEQRVFALMAIGHWVGDIHQPLHVSFADDRGGNYIDVNLVGKCGTSRYKVNNLHAVWDNCLLEDGLFQRVRERIDYRPSWSKRTLTYRAVDTLLANTTWSEEKSMVTTDPWSWANESYNITINPDVKYCIFKNASCQYSDLAVELERDGKRRILALGQDYLSDFDSIAENRIRLAGFRLAHIINLALDSNYKIPIQNSSQRP